MLLVRAWPRGAGLRVPRSTDKSPPAVFRNAREQSRYPSRQPSRCRCFWLPAAARVRLELGREAADSSSAKEQAEQGRGEAHRRRLRARRRSTCRPARRPSRSPTTAPRRSPSTRCSRRRILGEAENIAPGLDGKFYAQPGAPASTRCTARAATAERGTLAVTGDRLRPARTRARLDAVAAYRSLRRARRRCSSRPRRVRRRGQGRRRREGQGAVRPGPRNLRGDRAGRRELRRPRPRDRRARGRRARREWTGFHRIEKALWVDGTLDGMATLRRQADDRRRRAPGPHPDRPARAGPDRQRRGRAARRGVEVQDHRRGGSLLAHRPRRLPGQRRRLAGRVRRRCARSSPRATPALADTIDQRFAACDTALEPYRRGDGFVSYTELTERRHPQALAGDRRARRTALAGRQDRRHLAATSTATDDLDRVSERRASAVASCDRRRRGGRRSRSAASARALDRRRRRPPSAHVPFYGAHQAGSRRRRRTGCISPRSTSSPTSRRRPARPAADVDRGRGAMTAGLPVGPGNDDPHAPPDDTGEAVGLSRRG